MLQRTVDTLSFLASDPVGRAQGGCTPHRVIHRDNKACVRFFAPAEALYAPVFISMPLINTWTIFDLMPGKSVVAALVAAGVPVYLLDWGRAGPEDQPNGLAHYVDTVLGRAIDRSARHAGVEQLDAIGYCVGGTFLALHLARRAERVRRVAFLATPIDFHASGRLALWARPETFPLDAVIDGFGNFPRELMRTSFSWLRPMGQTGKYVGLWERIDDEGFRALWAQMEKWNVDGVDFPGEAYREYVRRCYFENALMNGGFTLAGQPCDLGAARIPALAIAASEDHIVPPAAAFGLEKAWGGPVQTRTVRGGHVGVCIGKALPSAFLEWVRA
jgi:polyhydroxyalkanoate synthase